MTNREAKVSKIGVGKTKERGMRGVKYNPGEKGGNGGNGERTKLPPAQKTQRETYLGSSRRVLDPTWQCVVHTTNDVGAERDIPSQSKK